MSIAVSPDLTTELRLDHLRALEAESIHIMREVVAEFERPVMLYSIGKDSSVLLRLAQKAFYPGPIPFPLLHIDTTYKFREMIQFRDDMAKAVGARLIVHTNEEAIGEGTQPFAVGTQRCCGLLKTQALLDAIAGGGFDAAFGGARRDEERSRAKERIFSLRDAHGQWDPKRQRPELWHLLNARIRPGESIRVFPLSNWTELDVWEYILAEELEIPGLYVAHQREVFERDGMLYAVSDFIERMDGEEPFTEWVRYRTVGDMTCTGAVRSRATTLDDVVAEIAATRVTERGETRADDRVSEAAMEDRKRVGYF
jgi:sulfate adenylyltransferase subunit 2